MVVIKVIAVHLEVSSNMLCYDPSILDCSDTHDSAPRILGNRIVRGGLVPAHMRPDNDVSVSATLAPL